MAYDIWDKSHVEGLTRINFTNIFCVVSMLYNFVVKIFSLIKCKTRVKCNKPLGEMQWEKVKKIPPTYSLHTHLLT